MKIYADNRMLSLGLVGGTVSRHGGNMRESASQNALYGQLNIPEKQILHFHQTHSDRIIRIASDADALSFQNQPEQEADAWLFSCGGWGAAILTADCVPLFLWDETASVFALAHCGWRGVAAISQSAATSFLRWYAVKIAWFSRLSASVTASTFACILCGLCAVGIPSRLAAVCSALARASMSRQRSRRTSSIAAEYCRSFSFVVIFPPLSW